MTFHPVEHLLKRITLTTGGAMLTLSLLFTAQCFSQEKPVSYSKPVLLVFSGSDWCSPCVRFKKEVLDNKAFVQFAKNRIDILVADFPQRTKLPDSIVRRNESLAERYNPGGLFPHLVLLDKNHDVLAEIPYQNQSASQFINRLTSLMPEPLTKEYKRHISAMGSFFEFIIVDSVQNALQVSTMLEKCTEEVNRIEDLISEWNESSETSLINRKAGIDTVEVSPELFSLIRRSLKISELTQGAFDITYHALDALWKFDGSQSQPPDTSAIALALENVGWQKIQLIEPNRVFLPERGMSIGFGGIGQGYAVDKVSALLRKKGYKNFIVNSSGDIYASGTRADGSPWKIGIANPFNKTEMIRWLEVDNKAVVTSGNYEKFFEYRGKRYAHIINPKTGWPAQGVVSTTVISPYAEVSDALATALFILGPEVGISLIDQLPGTHCIMIDDKKNVTYSRDLRDEYE